MKYRHYAPKADLSIVEGAEEEVVSMHQSSDRRGSVQKV